MRINQRNPRINFAQAIRGLQPTELELKKAKSHALSCKKRLLKSFDLKKFIKIGSHSRGTAIKHYSDLDFLAVLSKNEAKWGGNIVNSDTLINKLSQDLNDRFVQTSIRKDKQAIVANFGGGNNSLDIVPAIFNKFESNRPIYFIPNGNGGWMETSPTSHNSYINKQNEKCSEKLKKIGQLVRFWKYSRSKSIPISSFYIDLLLASSNLCAGAKSYPQLMYDFF